MLSVTALVVLCALVSLSGALRGCDIYDCPFNPCVDKIRVRGKCCPVCPGGQNCYANGQVHRGDEQTINGMRCRCSKPHEDGYKTNDGVCVPV